MLGRDLRYALRSMRLKPGFTAIAVASLALGIGANTAIFSLVDQLLLWSVPARDPGHLVRLDGGYSDAYPFYREYRDRNQVFSSVFASSRPYTAGLRPEGAPSVEVGHVHYVSGNYFSALGIGAAAGRVAAVSDDAAPGSGPIAVLSYSYWQRRFAGNLKVIGRKLAVNGFPLQIAGIAEKGFGGIYNGQEADAFVPLTMFPITNPAAARAWNTPSMFWLTTMGRLKPGVSVRQAQAAMQVLWPQAAEAVNEAAMKAGGRRRKFREQQITLQPGSSDPYSGRKEMTDPLRILAVATSLVLLIACANVANLLLSRATGRRREIAVRLAMGATRSRLIAQLLAESLVLAVAGGAIGLLCAWWGVSAMAKASILSSDLRFTPSWKVLAFSAVVTMFTAILFGLAPAFRATRLNLAASIKDGGAGGRSTSRMMLARALVAGQVALSLALLVGAGLFIRTLRNLQHVDVGFQRENILVADIDPTNLGYRGHRLRTFYDDLLERARRLPGVRSAGLSVMTPMGMYALSYSFSAEGYQPKPGERLVALANPVTGGYFTTLGIPLLLGRDFHPEDEPAFTPGDTILAAIGRASGSSNETPANASRVCIIDEQLARRFFAGVNPVGRHISYEDRYSAEGALEIVGVVKDAHYMGVRTVDREGTLYIPSWSNGAGARFLELRTSGDTGAVAAALRREVRALDLNVPVLRTSAIEDDFNRSLSRERMIAFLSGFFGLLALGLASVGLYGVMAYAVTERTREVGIRMALGARRGEVVAMVVRESLKPVLIGMAAGIGAALALTRLMAGLLYGVAPRDPLSIAAAAAAMLVVALLAAALPARRASRVEPMTALRYE
jgi:predicted permease